MLERETIYQRVWGYAMAHGDRSVDVFIRKLRQKLEKHSPSWAYIHTHFGIGYRLDPEPAGIVKEELRPGCRARAPRRRRLHRSFTRPSRRGNRRPRSFPPRSPSMATGTESSSSQLAAGRLQIRPEEHAALVDGRPLSLTMRELQLLVTLAAHPQRIMTREELFTEVWGASRGATTARSTSTSAASAPSSARRCRSCG